MSVILGVSDHGIIPKPKWSHDFMKLYVVKNLKSNLQGYILRENP